MYLKCHKRIKDGKEHRYRSVVESVRTRRGVMKRQLLYLDKLCDHKTELFSFLKTQWSLLFNASYDVLLYDLTAGNPEELKKKCRADL
jgi:hypothetical protein